MYKLTLSKSERFAFDFVGYRYCNGDDISQLLSGCLPEDQSWDDDRELTFSIPENVAWSIQELSSREDDLFPLFSSPLTRKMMNFLDQII